MAEKRHEAAVPLHFFTRRGRLIRVELFSKSPTSGGAPKIALLRDISFTTLRRSEL